MVVIILSSFMIGNGLSMSTHKTVQVSVSVQITTPRLRIRQDREDVRVDWLVPKFKRLGRARVAPILDISEPLPDHAIFVTIAIEISAEGTAEGERDGAFEGLSFSQMPFNNWKRADDGTRPNKCDPKKGSALHGRFSFNPVLFSRG